jgi:hypothetical protein
MMVSPDGKLLYLFRDKVIILNTSDFKVVDRIDMAKPEGSGLEQNSFGGGVELLRNNDEYVSLFTAADPYIHNKIFGIGRFKLASKSFDFTPIGPAPYQMAGLQITPDGKDGYTVTTQARPATSAANSGTLTLARTRSWTKPNSRAVRVSSSACRAMARSSTSMAPAMTSKSMTPRR